MSILINGVEMPKSCGKCFVGNREICVNGCPLVPVPPHGDLIDRDALLKKREFVCTDDDVDVRAVRYSVIVAAPTIIPAEEGE